jgi:hypothetical protein
VPKSCRLIHRPRDTQTFDELDIDVQAIASAAVIMHKQRPILIDRSATMEGFAP